MPSLFTTTKNTRALFKDSLRFIRSDVIHNLNEEEIQWLRDNNITTIVDLRTAKETKVFPCSLQDTEGFDYNNIPLSSGHIIPESTDKVVESYFDMLDDQLWKALDLIENAPTNVLYFCFAGKDRTGVVSALLHRRRNTAPEDIIADYIATHENLKDILEVYCRENPELDINVLIPKAEYMEQFLAGLEQRLL
jgi:protein tyrosine/serine phosphatase